MKLKFMTPRQASKDQHSLKEKIEKERIEKEEIYRMEIDEVQHVCHIHILQVGYDRIGRVDS